MADSLCREIFKEYAKMKISIKTGGICGRAARFAGRQKAARRRLGEGRKEKENQKPSQPKLFAMITMIAKPMPDCRFSSAYFIKNSLAV